MSQVYLGVFTGGVVYIMSSFGGSVALRPPICGDLFGIKVKRTPSRISCIVVGTLRRHVLRTVGGPHVGISAQRGGAC